MGEKKRRYLAVGIINDNASDGNDDDNEKASIYWAVTMCHSAQKFIYLYYLILTTTQFR